MSQPNIPTTAAKDEFMTSNELRSLRERKGNRSPELLKTSAANQLYYKACPLDEINLEAIFTYIDEFANERESTSKAWITKGLGAYTKCTSDKKRDGTEGEVIQDPVASGSGAESKIRPTLNSDLLAAYRRADTDGGSGKLTYVEDVLMENLLRVKADEAKEKIRIQKYKQHMKRFLKVYQLLQGAELDYSDALKMINTSSVREGYICGLMNQNETNSYWELSRQSFPVKMETFAVNRRRLLRDLARKYTRAVVLLKGGEDIYRYDLNEKYEFQQEPFFLWTFGATEPNLWGLLDCWTGRTILLCNRLTDENDDSRNTSKSSSPYLSELKAKYEVDETGYYDQLEEILTQINPKAVLILNGLNSDSGRQFPSIDIADDLNFDVDDLCLYGVMSNLRAIKTNFELDFMRYANKISSLAHRLLMKRISADSYEYQAEALFKFFVHFVGGCKDLSYKPVCASGHNTSDPNYSSNTRLIKCEDLIIFDMGASFYGYASSIGSTIPAGGLFNLEQKTIYDIVLRSRAAALEVTKAGVYWSEVHNQAMRTLLFGLCEVGILRGEIEDMLESSVSSVFMPFGIGHLIGLQNLDVGGFTEDSPEKGDSPHLSVLRTLRILQPGMVMAVQVACFFNPETLLKCVRDQLIKGYFVKEKLNRFLGMGGIYIKDNIIVTHQGYEMLTDLPRTIEDVENWIRGKYTDDFNVGFKNKENEKKDELWIGSKRNPCVNDEVGNRI